MSKKRKVDTKRLSRVERMKKKKRKKMLSMGIFCLSVVVFSVSIFLLWNWFQDNQKIDKLAKETSETVEKKEKEDNQNTELINPPEASL